MVLSEAGPACGALPFKQNGPRHRGTSPHQGKACGRPCVASPDDHIIADEPHPVMEPRLRARRSRRGIGRAVGVRLTGLLPCRGERVPAGPDHLHVDPPGDPADVGIARLEAEAEERWSVGGKQGHPPGSWLAMEAKPRPILACHVGDRRRARGAQRWAKIPAGYQQQATCSTAVAEVSQGVMPAAQHTAMTKHARHTTHSERFTHPLRPRVSRLGRAPRSCSKNLAHPVGAIKGFICHDNLANAAAIPWVALPAGGPAAYGPAEDESAGRVRLHLQRAQTGVPALRHERR
jgi:hypothetical protein